MARMFLLPIILSLFWALFLYLNGVPLRQGKKGFIYIIAISATLMLSLGFLLWLTAEQNLRG
ncbi:MULTISPECIES: hypothetical protein [Shewanella]|uniref:Uncharacterized protein n=1 Tax=Shewanella marisflavi TaxID=260364 RepID=A0AAC9U0V0_9GAMM|nr:MULTISPECIES: hypothetical protein [Shewanella]ASJ97468.1 hypothetical protein CFF01_13250 [Shewanella marisflavi]MCL1040744.1 hypothetical protein [Shewanella marisflavi]QDF76020.1 hypothetical protein FGA12_13155 [Shewanella marisflavi]